MKNLTKEEKVFLLQEYIDPIDLREARRHITQLDRILGGKFRLSAYIQHIEEILDAKMEYDEKEFIA